MKTGHLNPVLTVYSLYMALMKVGKLLLLEAYAFSLFGGKHKNMVM